MDFSYGNISGAVDRKYSLRHDIQHGVMELFAARLRECREPNGLDLDNIVFMK